MENSVFAVFPGQGSQQLGMGKIFCESFGLARELFEEASDAAQVNLKKLCFDGPESDLTLTENLQPALLAVSVVAFRVCQKEFGFKPRIVAGHSLGEYSALVAAGAFPFASAVRWVRARGRAMQAAVPAGKGSMAAIMGLQDAVVESLCKKAEVESREIVSPANFNAPGQVVIAGSSEGVQKALALTKSDPEFQGAKAIPLSVSAPFHCRLMEPARTKMSELFKSAQPHEKPSNLNYPYLPNRTARLTQEASVVFDLLVEQVDHPVLWSASVTEALRHLGSSAHVVEFGPGKVLVGLTKRVAAAQSLPVKLSGVSDVSTMQSLEKELHV